MKTENGHTALAEREMIRVSDVVPGEMDLFGEIAIDAEASIRCTNIILAGGLARADLVFEADQGRADYTLLGGKRYFAEWGRYRFGRGLSLLASTDQPLIQLHFQLEGATPHVNTDVDFGVDLDLRAGQSNLTFLPDMDGSFELIGDTEGNAFSTVLSTEFFTGLAERHPHLLEDFVTRIERAEPFTLRQTHLPITPHMRAVIQRIQQHDAMNGAGSLFLEGQILELLSLQLSQVEQPGSGNGHRRLSRSDAERIREAAGLLLERMDDPPTLAELARHALMNEFKLKRGFREIFGTSPYAYLLDHKLELARSYLLDTDWSIARISRLVGYRDPAHLTNAFRKQYGIRPSDLRANGGHG